MIRWHIFENIKGMKFTTVDGTMNVHPDEMDEDVLFKLATDAMYLRDYAKDDLMLELVFEELSSD